MRSVRLTSLGCVPALAAFASWIASPRAIAQDLLWVDQVGTSGLDAGRAVVPDGEGGVFAAGYTEGSLLTQGLGLWDGWLARYDQNGNRLWGLQLGTSSYESAEGIAADGSGGVYVSGYTLGSLSGASIGGSDGWVARIDELGNRQWVRQLGTAEDDRVWGAASDGHGGVFIAGTTEGSFGSPNAGGMDAWIGRLNESGDLLWVRQIGTTSDDRLTACSTDGADGAYICGWTPGSLGGPAGGANDVWIARYDTAGNQVWIRQPMSASNEIARTVAPDGLGGVYVGGATGGDFAGTHAGGIWDAWAAHFDGSGNQVWLKQFGSTGEEETFVSAPDGSGGVYVGGYYIKVLTFPIGVGFDAWFSRYDASGNLLWNKWFGSDEADAAYGAAPDGRGGLFLCGHTWGNIDAPPEGGQDIWVAHFDGSCAPGRTFCIPSATSIPGCQASLTATGSPTLSDPTAWTASSGPVPGANLGLLLFGSSGKDDTPYGTLGGMLCVASPTFRTAPKTSGGDQGQCNGSYAFTLADLIAASPIVTSAATIHAQVWARDPASQDGFLLSDGLTATICP